MRAKDKISWIAVAAAAVLISGLSALVPAQAKNNTGAIVGGIIAGAAIGAAVSSAAAQPRTVVVVPAAPPPPQAWGQVFAPRPGVNCYPAQRACYYANGAYNANWTYKIYAR